jgi:DNA-binding MarR family transcriptional regulator
MGFRMSDLTADELRGLPLGRLLLYAHRRAQAASLAKLQQRGHAQVRPGHLPVITNLDADGTRISDLANRAGMTRQMMGRLVRELEDLDYVDSRSDPTDQRAVIVTLTERGTRFLADAPEAIDDVERDYADLLGPDELRQLRVALIKLSTTSPTA